ncbi:MAG: hypothetical protein IPH34_03455 [Chitinophagaceae bacterium]|nr:hypothetical protein [Chitinophagaceae bacterium]
MSQDSRSVELLPIKKSLFSGNGGIGVDFGLGNSGLSLSPELKYTAGFSDTKDPAATTSYNLALSSLKKNTFSFNLYLRKR